MFGASHALASNSPTGLGVIDALQPFCEETRDADSKAFTALMKHLREIDSESNTVLMVQVENEIGLMEDSRDRSSKADGPIGGHQAFAGGEWADDIFMADAFSRFVQRLAAAGKRECSIPLYLNVALFSEDASWDDFRSIPDDMPVGSTPGKFPSGGPVGHNLDVYRFNAPAIDLYGPDIYLQDYEKVSECFAWRNMPLFIPEQRRDANGVRRMWTALSNNLAIGGSPFGIDSLPIQACSLPLHYKLMSKLSKYILDAQANRPEDLFGFFFDEVEESNPRPGRSAWIKDIGGYQVTVERAFVFGKPSSGRVTFKSLDPKSIFSGILAVEEKDVDENGGLFTIRTLNGDETNHHRVVAMPSEDPDYGGFPIPALVPAKTMIVSARP
ncbi:hypothetical protein ACJ41O_015254 [Fusarium nematophilum]